MLSYRHGFHAGNPADVFKHAVLLAVVDAMQIKPKGIAVLDTHAGPAVYDLAHAYAQKNREYERGIGAVWDTPPEPLKPYVETIRAHNPDKRLRRYPGSPQLLRARLRPQDRLTLCELHPTEQNALSDRFSGDEAVRVVAGDGYATLAAIRTPSTGRGLTLIDPPYERKSELDDLAQALAPALGRFAHGVYVIWYPILESRSTAPDGLPGALDLDEDAWLDLRIRFPAAQRLGRMSGCGMALINPPWSAREPLLRIAECWPTGRRA